MITLERQHGIPMLCAKHSTEPDDDGKFQSDDEIMAWAYVFKHLIGRCPQCHGQNVIRDKILSSNKTNGTQWWHCTECGKKMTTPQLQEAVVTVFDLAWIQKKGGVR